MYPPHQPPHQTFGAFFKPPLDWVHEHDVHLFVDFISAVGMAELYWPRSHQDADAWYTVLVCVDIGAGMVAGGDFSFSSHGTVLEARHGDVFFFNPSYFHSCTEPHPASGGKRLFISFYSKRATLRAGIRSMEV